MAKLDDGIPLPLRDYLDGVLKVLNLELLLFNNMCDCEF